MENKKADICQEFNPNNLQKQNQNFSNFRHVLNVVCFVLGDSWASESPNRKHTTRTKIITESERNGSRKELF